VSDAARIDAHLRGCIRIAVGGMNTFSCTCRMPSATFEYSCATVGVVAV
jgi:hypothetical protein